MYVICNVRISLCVALERNAQRKNRLHKYVGGGDVPIGGHIC